VVNLEGSLNIAVGDGAIYVAAVRT